MSFGSFLKKQYENATDSAKEAFNKMSEAVYDTGEYLADGATYVKDKAISGATYVKDEAIEGAAYVKDKAVAGTKYVSDKISEARKKVDKYLSPKPAGQKIIYCPDKTKAQRVALRKEKISKAKEKLNTMEEGDEKDLVKNATERFEFNNDGFVKSIYS